MPKKAKIKRCIVYMPERLYYQLAAALKELDNTSVSSFFRGRSNDYLARFPTRSSKR